MRSSIFAHRTAVLGAGIIVSAVIVACATAGDPADGAVSVSSDASSEAALLPPDDSDASEPEDASNVDAAAPCSPDGWCPTTLPGTDIYVGKSVPFEKRAFARMNSAFIGNRVAEWTPEGGWTLLKGVDQSDWPQAQSEGDFWASDEDTVYLSVLDLSGLSGGTFSAIVARGRRPVAPATEWTWTQSRIPCDWFVQGAGIGGTKDGNVYVATCGKILRLDTSADAGAASDGGADAGGETLRWIDDGFVDVDPTTSINFFEIDGTGPDDLWFAGRRGDWCAILVHKTSDGYRTVMDGISEKSACSPRGDLPMVPGGFVGMHAFSKNRLIAALSSASTATAGQLINVGHSGDHITVQSAQAPAGTNSLRSPWVASEDDLFVIAKAGASSPGGSFLLRGRSLWGNNPSYDFSQLAINGVRNPAALISLRGTSAQNLWAVGGGYAYHKTTP